MPPYLPQGVPPPKKSVTVIVAASDSLHKEMADYICDGVDDHVEINAALNALPSTGGEVVLLDGTFHVEATVGRNIGNITVRGQGGSTVLTTSTPGLAFLSFAGSDGAELKNITIADLVIDGANLVADVGIYFSYVDNSVIQNVCVKWHRYSTGARRSGICLDHSDLNRVENNLCQYNGFNGIRLYYSNNNTVSGNTCQGNYTSGIYLYYSSNNTVSGNTCQNYGDGIYLNNSNNNTVSGNTCQGNNGYGIYIYSSSNNTVSGNTCQGNSYQAIYLYYSNNNTVSGNTCQGTDWDGIYLSHSNNNTVSGNISRSNNGYGIYLEYSNNNTVSGNTCQGNNRDGIYVYSSSNNTIVGNTSIENSQSSNNAYDDIRTAYYSSYNNIQGNTCRAGALTNKPRYGINIAASTCTGNLVTNNDIRNDGFGTGSLNDAGTGTVTTPGNRT
jgi:parallel beta-helix repeat protein